MPIGRVAPTAAIITAGDNPRIIDVGFEAYGAYYLNSSQQWLQVGDPPQGDFLPPSSRGTVALYGYPNVAVKWGAPAGVPQPSAVANQQCFLRFTERPLDTTGGSLLGTQVSAVIQAERFLRANIPAPGTAGRVIQLIDYDRGLWIDDGTDPLWSITGQIVNVKSRGARGDGITDDRAAIQAAIDAAEVVYFPPGTYQIAAGLTHTDNKTLIGAAYGQSIIRGALSAALLGPVNPAVRAFNLRIENLQFDNTNRATAGGIGLDLTNMSDGHFYNLLIKNAETGVQLRGNGGAGGCLYNRFVSCIFSTCGRGVFGNVAGGGPGPNEQTFTGCRAVDMNGVACWDNNDGTNWYLFGCAAETFTNRAVRCNTAPGIKIYGMRIENGGLGTGVEKTAAANRIVVQGCYFAVLNNFVGFTPVLSAVDAGIAGGSTIVGTDSAGLISFTTTGAPPAAGTSLMVVTHSSFSSRPAVVVANSNGTTVAFGTTAGVAGSWTLVNITALVALTAYTVDYVLFPKEESVSG